MHKPCNRRNLHGYTIQFSVSHNTVQAVPELATDDKRAEMPPVVRHCTEHMAYHDAVQNGRDTCGRFGGIRVGSLPARHKGSQPATHEDKLISRRHL